MLNITPRPSFQRFLDTLLLRKAYRRPPLFDFHVHQKHKDRMMGHEVKTPKQYVDFWVCAGYDYVQSTVHVWADEREEAIRAAQAGQATHSSDHAIIESLEHFRSRTWSWQAAESRDFPSSQRNLELLKGMVKCLPSDMKIMLHNADIFTYAWEMLGFNNLCFLSIEEPQFVKEVMDSLGRAQLAVTRRAAEICGNKLGFIFYSDDIAYTEGLMLSPGFFREMLFPWIERFVALGREYGVPLVYHTDGRLYDVFDDFARIGVKGVQPLEPKSMDPLIIKERWPRKFCLMGNIDLDLMARGSADDVEKYVRDRIDKLNVGGGYMPGVSNTVPDYVNFDNYVRMIETVYSYEGK